MKPLSLDFANVTSFMSRDEGNDIDRLEFDHSPPIYQRTNTLTWLVRLDMKFAVTYGEFENIIEIVTSCLTLTTEY
jgi:hypothetical protein